MNFEEEDMVDALEEISGRISKLEGDGKENFQILTFQIHQLQKEVGWQTKALEEFFAHEIYTK